MAGELPTISEEVRATLEEMELRAGENITPVLARAIKVNRYLREQEATQLPPEPTAE